MYTIKYEVCCGRACVKCFDGEMLYFFYLEYFNCVVEKLWLTLVTCAHSNQKMDLSSFSALI